MQRNTGISMLMCKNIFCGCVNRNGFSNKIFNSEVHCYQVLRSTCKLDYF